MGHEMTADESQVKPIPRFGYRPGSNGMVTYESVVEQFKCLIEQCRIYSTS